jgi:hypothetical protein
MHIVILALSYAFSIWMVVDAFKRGAQSWWIVIIFVPFGEFVYFFVVKAKDYRGAFTRMSPEPRKEVNNRGWAIPDSPKSLKCDDCIYCEAVDEDGVVCLSNGSRAFKPLSYTSFCYDNSKKRGRLV